MSDYQLIGTFNGKNIYKSISNANYYHLVNESYVQIEYGTLKVGDIIVNTAITNREDKWVQGFACALSQLLIFNGMNTTVSDEMFRDGIGSIEKAVAAGVHENDLFELRKYYK